MLQKLPIGRSDFKTIIEDNDYYVDKTLFVKEIIDQSASVILIPRPRRFGKTLNLTTLRYFYEKVPNQPDEVNRHLFEHLAIWQQGDEYTQKQGKYPVIYLTFKDVKVDNWGIALNYLTKLIVSEFERHSYIFQSQDWLYSPNEKLVFDKVSTLQATQDEYESSLKLLTSLLSNYYGTKVILLIDEYDTPIHASFVHGYYDEMINFMRNLLSGGLKDNEYLEKSVITGILRVAKESIFSGLNNLKIASILSHAMCDKFGLTEEEVEQLCIDFNVKDEIKTIKKWYNGYFFGNQVVYNPWSVLSYIDSMEDGFRPYWINTSSNDIVKELIYNSTSSFKSDLEELIAGRSISKPVESNISFNELSNNENNIWSFLLFSGYLKAENAELRGTTFYYDLTIPKIGRAHV